MLVMIVKSKHLSKPTISTTYRINQPNKMIDDGSRSQSICSMGNSSDYGRNKGIRVSELTLQH